MSITGSSASMRPPGGRTQTDSAHKPENRHLGGRRHVGWEGLVLTRETGACDSRAADQLDNVEEVPLAGLSSVVARLGAG